MKPLERFKALCDHQFVVGEEYPLGLFANRSPKSLQYYMGRVQAGFDNLPENLKEKYPSPEHLRAWCLCRVGYATHRQYVMKNAAEARKMAREERKDHPYAVIAIKDETVDVWNARSQSRNVMEEAEFEESKSKVLDLISQIIGVSVDDLHKDSEPPPQGEPNAYSRR